jgi:hypothetical protein
MQQLLPEPPATEPENRFPNCVYVKLSGTPVEAAASSQPELLLPKPATKSHTVEQIDLYLTIRFGEHKQQLPGGSVTFGLKGGELKFQLDNCQVPLEKIALSDEFEVAIETQQQEEKSSQKQGSGTIALNPTVTSGNTEAEKIAKTYKTKVYQVRTKGTETAPVWEFVAKANPCLQGLLKEAKLATIKVIDKPCGAKATFEVDVQNVYLTDAGWLLEKNLIKKKSAVIERRIIKNFLEAKLKPYLSRVEWRYE